VSSRAKSGVWLIFLFFRQAPLDDPASRNRPRMTDHDCCRAITDNATFPAAYKNGLFVRAV
jgi:hypothetical protein